MASKIEGNKYHVYSLSILGNDDDLSTSGTDENRKVRPRKMFLILLILLIIEWLSSRSTPHKQ